MITTFINDEYFRKTWANTPVPRRANLVGDPVRWDTLTYTEEPLWIPQMIHSSWDEFVLRLRWLREYPGPVITNLCFNTWPIKHVFKRTALAADHVLALCARNHQDLPNLAGEWYRVYPELFFRGNWSAPRGDYGLYLGRVDGRKKPTWIAGTLETWHLRGYETRVITEACGVGGMPVWNLEEVPKFRGMPRPLIAEELKRARAALCYTDHGHGSHYGLENVMLECFVAGCAPILNAKWCTTLYAGYPLQVSSLDEARCVALPTEQERAAALDFLVKAGEPDNSCRTPAHLKYLLEQAAARPLDIRARQERIDELLAWFDAGGHQTKLTRRDWE